MMPRRFARRLQLLLLLLLFLLLLELLLLPGLIFLLLFSLVGRLLLARLDIGLVLRRFRLLLLEALLLLDALLGLLRSLLMCCVELALEVGLLRIVGLLVRGCLRGRDTALRLIDRVLLLLLLERLLVRGTLRRFRLALRLVQLMLTLLVVVRLCVACVLRSASRCVRLVLRALDRGLFVALTRVFDALFVVKRELLLADIGSDDAHVVTRRIQAMIDEKLAITVVLGDGVTVVVVCRAGIERLLARFEIVRSGNGRSRVGSRRRNGTLLRFGKRGRERRAAGECKRCGKRDTPHGGSQPEGDGGHGSNLNPENGRCERRSAERSGQISGREA